MSADAPQAAQDRWCDAEGTRIALFCWVEQIAEHPEHGARLEVDTPGHHQRRPHHLCDRDRYAVHLGVIKAMRQTRAARTYRAGHPAPLGVFLGGRDGQA